MPLSVRGRGPARATSTTSTAEARIEAGQLVFYKPGAAAGDDWSVAVKLPPEALKGEACRVVIPADRLPGASVSGTFLASVSKTSGDMPAGSLALRDSSGVSPSLPGLVALRIP